MAHYYIVAPTKLVRTDQDRFTYHSDQTLEIGTLVRVPIGRQNLNGVVWQESDKPAFETKAILSIIEKYPLPVQLLRLSEWLADYYSTHLALVLQTVLPAGIQKNRRVTTKTLSFPERERTIIVLNTEQQHAIEQIRNATAKTIILKGITGSGKTQVYIETAKLQAKLGRSSIILVPEIALTPQLVAEFRHDFSDEQLLVTHSRMTEADRHLAWRRCLESTTPIVVIGPRSALFSPVARLGLIVIDESHEPSFKQDKSPRYSAIRAATMLAKYAGARTILGSATPSITDYYLAHHANAPIITLSKRARPSSTKAEIKLVSFLDRSQFSKHRFLSNILLRDAAAAIAAGKQVLLFHNRRGSAPVTMCSNCGWSSLCPNCYIPLTLHVDTHTLLCHLCAHSEKVPFVCPQCQNPDIVHKGIGTKQIENELHKQFPHVTIARFDADNDATETVQANYQALYDGDIQIIIGTQLIAKGLDLPKLRLVGIIQAESGLFLPDFQAEERVFQLLYQVAGRVGRQADADTNVIIQTYQPNHPVIQFGLHKDYEGFYEHTITERQASHFPPFVYLLKLTCSYATEAAAIKAARSLAEDIRHTHPDVYVLGPTPAFYERMNGRYRWQLLIKSPHRTILQTIALETPKPWFVDLDPHNLL